MPEKHVDICKEKDRLLQRYTDSTRVFSEAVATLSARRGVTERQDYELLERGVLDARLKSEQARLAYEQHVAEHKC
jgi:hypothetical protein